MWSLVRPLMLFAVLLFVFTQIFKLGSEPSTHYPVLLLLGIVIFTFFQEATTSAVTSVVAQEGIVRKTQFPRLVIPLAIVLTGVFNLGLNLIVVLAFILAFGVEPTWTWLLFPFAAALLFVLTAAVSMLALRRSTSASATSRSSGPSPRQVLFYATPILYPVDFKPNLEGLLMINPIGGHPRAGPRMGPRTNRPRPPRSRRPAAGWACCRRPRYSSGSAHSASGSSTARPPASPRTSSFRRTRGAPCRLSRLANDVDRAQDRAQIARRAGARTP